MIILITNISLRLVNSIAMVIKVMMKMMMMMMMMAGGGSDHDTTARTKAVRTGMTRLTGHSVGSGS